MSQQIKLKRTNVSGNIPTPEQLSIGEVALNMADSALYFKDPSNTIKELSGTLQNLRDVDVSNAQTGSIFRNDGTNWVSTNSFKILNNGHVTVGGAGDVHAFNVYATGLNSRLSFQSESGGNPGVELSTDKTGTRRVLIRLNEYGSSGTSIQFYTRPASGGSVENTMTLFPDDLSVQTSITATGNITAPNLNITNWDTAFTWGNHAEAGYLTTDSTVNNANNLGNVPAANYLRNDVDGQFNGQLVISNPTADKGALKIIQAKDDPDSPASILIATDNDNEDVAFEVRGNSSGPSVDTTDRASNNPSPDMNLQIWSNGNLNTKGEITVNSNKVFHEGSTGNKGDMYYHDGTKWVKLAAGTVGQILSVGSDGTPEWQDLTVR